MRFRLPTYLLHRSVQFVQHHRKVFAFTPAPERFRRLEKFCNIR
jgi:hypothetical protein